MLFKGQKRSIYQHIITVRPFGVVCFFHPLFVCLLVFLFWSGLLWFALAGLILVFFVFVFWGVGLLWVFCFFWYFLFGVLVWFLLFCSVGFFYFFLLCGFKINIKNTVLATTESSNLMILQVWQMNKLTITRSDFNNLFHYHVKKPPSIKADSIVQEWFIWLFTLDWGSEWLFCSCRPVINASQNICT